jgi:hypothetical protein
MIVALRSPSGTYADVALRAERSGTTRHKRRLGETRTPRQASRRPRLQ